MTHSTLAMTMKQNAEGGKYGSIFGSIPTPLRWIERLNFYTPAVGFFTELLLLRIHIDSAELIHPDCQRKGDGVLKRSSSFFFRPLLFSSTMGDTGGDICAILFCGLCCTAGSSALNTWSIQNNWGADGCCAGNGQAGCCGSCCDKCFNEDNFDEQTKKMDQQMQGAQQMVVPPASEPTVSIPETSKDAEA
ncbi:hypothetical protein IW262DRAFT_1295716 [Armillaria fumosa]|nr:hypothetical protein IW262DRAFT_1295716 [Armillaria fumosa]